MRQIYGSTERREEKMTAKSIRRTMISLLLAGSAMSMSCNAQTPAHEGLTFNGDGATRSDKIHWPKVFDPKEAELFAHNEIVVHAGCGTVFANLADAESWPSWYSNSKDVKVLNTQDHRLKKNARFSWETFGLHIDSRVHEFEPDSRIGWFGDGNGVHAYHTFFLETTSEGCHIVTEEVVKGPGAVQFREEQRCTRATSFG
jgi:uncharacterized membrane protein